MRDLGREAARRPLSACVSVAGTVLPAVALRVRLLADVHRPVWPQGCSFPRHRLSQGTGDQSREGRSSDSEQRRWDFCSCVSLGPLGWWVAGRSPCEGLRAKTSHSGPEEKGLFAAWTLEGWSGVEGPSRRAPAEGTVPQHCEAALPGALGPAVTGKGVRGAPLMFWFRHYVVSDSLRPHGLQHARLPCPSLLPGVCSGRLAKNFEFFLNILWKSPSELFGQHHALLSELQSSQREA